MCVPAAGVPGAGVPGAGVPRAGVFSFPLRSLAGGARQECWCAWLLAVFGWWFGAKRQSHWLTVTL